VTRHPHNLARRIGHDGHAIAFVPRDFAIDENVLQLLVAGCAQRPQPITWPALTNSQRSAELARIHYYPAPGSTLPAGSFPVPGIHPRRSLGGDGPPASRLFDGSRNAEVQNLKNLWNLSNLSNLTNLPTY
jgi:hypothetical protein